MSTYRLKNLLAPRSVALVGASPRHGSVGRAILNNIRKAQFKGEFGLVNPGYAEIDGVATVGSIPKLAFAHRHGLFPDLSTRQARASDIIVVGEAAGGGLADPFVQVNPSDLVMQVGRPLLLFPRAAAGWTLRSVLVAWKNTAEARRAVNDALPLLRKSTEIKIVEIVEDEADRAAALLRVEDVAAWLSRHGVRHRSRCPGNVAMPPRNWSKWHRTSAPAWLLPALMATQG